MLPFFFIVHCVVHVYSINTPRSPVLQTAPCMEMERPETEIRTRNRWPRPSHLLKLDHRTSLSIYNDLFRPLLYTLTYYSRCLDVRSRCLKNKNNANYLCPFRHLEPTYPIGWAFCPLNCVPVLLDLFLCVCSLPIIG